MCFSVTEQKEPIDILETNDGRDETMLLFCECCMESITGPISQNEVIEKVAVKLLELNNPTKVTTFISYLSTKYKVPKKLFNDQIKVLTKARNEKIAKNKTFNEEGEELDDSEHHGWYEQGGRYWFYNTSGIPVAGSNFTLKPLFHIYSKSDNKRLVQITNVKGYSKIIDIPSRTFISIEQFQAYVYNEGNFLFLGNKQNFMKILQHISDDFPVCNELRTLGWQREGFFAFANGIYDGTWQPVDEFGITVYKQAMYFSPAFSVVYNNVREDDDEYENDRFFCYKPAPCTFGEWTSLMKEVYQDNAVTGIAFAIASVFRDLIYEKYKIFPHLFLFGEKQSGKSQLAWSLSNLFFNNLPAFNLNSGTQVGFFRRLSRIKNAITWFDEYCNEIMPARFQALKSAFDGVGHEKGKMSQDSRTIVTKINSSLLISGQHLPTLDDNALYTRSCLLSFVKRKFTQQELDNYDKLKGYEVEGLSSLVGDILQFRECVDKNYGMQFTEVMGQLKTSLNATRYPYDERLVRNYCCLLTPIAIIQKQENPLQFNFTFDDLFAIAVKNIIEMSKQISNSESISTFWKMTEFLLDEGKISEKIDFKFDTIRSIKVTDKNGQVHSLDFPAPERCLFLRLTRIHSLYMEKHRQQTGKNGVDIQSILYYLQSHKSYLGHSDKVRFDTSVSTAYVFKYGEDELNVNLERIVREKFADEAMKESEKNSPPAQTMIEMPPVEVIEPPF